MIRVLVMSGVKPFHYKSSSTFEGMFSGRDLRAHVAIFQMYIYLEPSDKSFRQGKPIRSLLLRSVKAAQARSFAARSACHRRGGGMYINPSDKMYVCTWDREQRRVYLRNVLEWGRKGPTYVHRDIELSRSNHQHAWGCGQLSAGQDCASESPPNILTVVWMLIWYGRPQDDGIIPQRGARGHGGVIFQLLYWTWWSSNSVQPTFPPSRRVSTRFLGLLAGQLRGDRSSRTRKRKDRRRGQPAFSKMFFVSTC